MQITSLDGEWFPSMADDAEILPGFHYVSVRYRLESIGGSARAVRDCVIEFEAEAQHEYLIEFDTRDQQWGAWLTDATTGKLAAECSWTAGPLPSERGLHPARSTDRDQSESAR